MSGECLFCRIAKKEIPSEIVYEDTTSVAFLDIKPLAPGHTMIIPKVHSETILDLPESRVGPLFLTVKKVTDILSRRLKPEGFTIGINHGHAGGAVVEHLHIHVIPRFKGDGGGSLHSVVHNPPKEPLKAIAEKLRLHTS